MQTVVLYYIIHLQSSGFVTNKGSASKGLIIPTNFYAPRPEWKCVQRRSKSIKYSWRGRKASDDTFNCAAQLLHVFPSQYFDNTFKSGQSLSAIQSILPSFWKAIGGHCPLLSIVFHCYPLLSGVVHCCPVLSIVIHCYPLLSIVVHCCYPLWIS